MLVGWAGGVGGVIHGGLLKLKNSSSEGCAASRRVSDGRSNRCSMNFRIAVESIVVCDT